MEPNIEIVAERMLAAMVAEELSARIAEVIEDRDRCSLLLAGGTTPGAIYRRLARPPFVSDIPWEKLILFWGDERWVSQSSSQSNYYMVQETLLAELGDNQPMVVPVATSLSSPEEGALDYERRIREQGYCVQGFSPPFDIALLGVGEDGHIASLFPNSRALGEMERLCVSCDQPGTGQPRVTMTLAALRASERIYFIIRGESKAEVVDQLFQGVGSSEALPARFFLGEVGSRVTWFLDSQAGARLRMTTGEK